MRKLTNVFESKILTEAVKTLDFNDIDSDDIKYNYLSHISPRLMDKDTLMSFIGGNMTIVNTSYELRDYISVLYDIAIDYGYNSINLNNFDVSKIKEFYQLFPMSTKKDFTFDISKWDTSKATKFSMTFAYTQKIKGINKLDVSNVKEFTNTFDSSHFNGKLDKWNTSSAIDMQRMFYGAQKFNQDLSMWDVSNLTISPNEAFWGCDKLNFETLRKIYDSWSTQIEPNHLIIDKSNFGHYML